MKKYSFVGSDERTNYLRKMFLEEGYEITDILKSDIVVTSIPFSKNDKTLNSEDLSVEDFIRLTKNKIVITGSIKEYIKSLNEKTNGHLRYIGEWHTHTSGNASPSKRDIKTFEETKVSTDMFLMTIISPTNTQNYIIKGKKQ